MKEKLLEQKYSSEWENVMRQQLMKENQFSNNSSFLSHISYLKRKTLSCFTLIELLIVIAIIAITIRSNF